MSRYCGPRLRIIRRLGQLPGLTRKTSKIKTPPGEHGAARKTNKVSQYSSRLHEKQRLRYNYGITERKLLYYIKKAVKSENSTGDVLLQLLEMRLDNIVYRLGFTPSIASARQMINHRKILVNNSLVTIASYQCQPKDIISLAKQGKTNLDKKLPTNIPSHLQLETNSKGKIVSIINRQQVGVTLNERLIVEFYSRKI